MIAKYVCPVCGLAMAPVSKVVVKHIDGNCYNANLWSCKENCSRFLEILEETECGNREFKFKPFGFFSIIFDMDELSWI